MRLKIKIKNLIIFSLATIFVILIVVPFTTLQLANILHGMNSDSATVFYESYLRKAIKPNEVEALYKYAVHLSGTKDKYLIMLNGWSGPESKTTLQDMEKAKNSLIKILDNEKRSKKYSGLAYKKLLDVLVSSGENHELIKWVEYGSVSEDEKIEYTSNIYYALLNGNYELADQILDNYNGALDKDYYNIKGYIALLEGDDELAKEYYNKGGISFWYEEYEDLLKGDYKVRGKVSYNGVGIPFAEIYIQEDTGVFRTGSFGFSAITDINGEYETIGLKPGRYDIGIGLNHVLLYDKVHLTQNIRFLDLENDMEFNYEFAEPIKVLTPSPGTIIDSSTFVVKWEPLEGADYYNIETIAYSNPMDKSGGMVTYPIKYRFKSENPEENGTVFETDRLRSENRVYGYDEGMVPTPATFIGGFYPGFDYTIIVKAFDSAGNLVGSSQGQRVYFDQMNSVKIKGKLSKGENIILKKEYEKAIDYYKEILDNNPEDLEAIRYLAKFYTFGWKEGTVDYIKATEYAKGYYVLNNDTSLLMQIISRMNNKEKSANKTVVKEILAMVAEEDKDIEYYRQLGDYYLSISEYDEAINAYERIDVYLPINLLYIDLYLGDFNSALERLDLKEFELYRMSRKTLTKSIEKLGIEDLGTKDYIYLKEVLEKILNENLSSEKGKEFYNEIRLKISNPDIKAILDEIKLEQYWEY